MALHFRRATGVYVKTLPFVLLQFGIGIVFALFGMLYLGLVAWLAYRFFWGGGGYSLLIVGAVMLGGFVSFIWIWRMIKRYALYLVNAGHVAVVAHVVTEDEVPENQIRYGFDRVKGRFLSTSALFAIDEIVDAVLKQFTRAVTRLQNLLPMALPANLRTLLGLLQKSIVLAIGYVDEAILAYIFVDREENAWRSARDGVVLYGKTWKTVLGSTIAVVFGMYALAFVLALLLAPTAVVLDFLPTTIEVASWLVVGGIIAVVHTGIVKPWVKTVVITTFLLEQREHTPDSETMAWIEERSDRFSELVERAETEEPVDQARPDQDASPDVPDAV